MAHYHIEFPHADGQCVRAFDFIAKYGLHFLNHTWFGCDAGVHTGWLHVEADNEREARGMLAPLMRDQARIVEVRSYTLQQIKDLHS